MTDRIIFLSDNGEIQFKIQNRNLFENIFHKVAFIAESGKHIKFVKEAK